MSDTKLKSRSERLRGGSPSQAYYEALLEEIANVRLGKVKAYGESRYEDDDLDHAMMLAYADVHRKYIRIRNLVKNRAYSGGGDGETLREAFRDLGNYALMGMQLYDKLVPEAPVADLATVLLDMESPLGVPAAPAAPTEPKCRFPIDQIAVVTKNSSKLISLLHRIFQPWAWHVDRVKACGAVFGKPAENVADLAFNYNLIPGVEFEVLEYVEGRNWHDDGIYGTGLTEPGLSHFGVHVTSEQMETACKVLREAGYKVAQEVKTTSHTNPVIKDSRWYHYVIFDTRADFGFDLKLIERLPYPPSTPSPSLPDTTGLVD